MHNMNLSHAAGRADPNVLESAAFLNRMLKNPIICHPEEPQAVLSETKEGSLH